MLLKNLWFFFSIKTVNKKAFFPYSLIVESSLAVTLGEHLSIRELLILNILILKNVLKNCHLTNNILRSREFLCWARRRSVVSYNYSFLKRDKESILKWNACQVIFLRSLIIEVNWKIFLLIYRLLNYIKRVFLI